MKTAVAFLVICVALAVEAAHNRKHKAHVKAEHEEEIEGSEEEEGGWPQPDAVRKFEVPEGFTAASPPETNFESSTPSSGKHHHQKLSHKKRTTHYQ